MAVINNQEQTYQKPGVGTIIGGVLVGSTVKALTIQSQSLIATKIGEKIGEISKSLTEDEFKYVKQAIDETVEKSGLAEKGVSIVNATAENADEISKIITKEMNSNVFTKYFPDKIKGAVGKIFHSNVQKGKNACYAFKSQKIIIPETELILTGFHEIGHAANQNLSKIGKILQ